MSQQFLHQGRHMQTRINGLFLGLVALAVLASPAAFSQQQPRTDLSCTAFASPVQNALDVHPAAESAAFQFEFPRDYFNHPSYSWEWWYFSGNLRGEDQHDYGFELVFFRRTASAGVQTSASRQAAYYFADFAISDLTGGKFYYYKHFKPNENDFAGVDQVRGVWNGDWHVKWLGETLQDQELEASAEQSGIHLLLHPEKPPAVHDQDGNFTKDCHTENRGHYFSLSRITAIGDLVVNGAKLRVHGLAWMDHEFFNLAPSAKMPTWDWFAIQLNDGQDLMLYRLRNSDGSVSRLASGTLVDKNGGIHHLAPGSFDVQPGSTWHSPVSGGRYPVDWSIAIPSEALLIHAATPLPSQELVSKKGDVTPTYWEGAVRYSGSSGSKPVAGVGYLEMTGYGALDPR